MGAATGRDFDEVLRLVIDLGGDTDTAAAVAGGIAGAVFGMGGIPMRWSSAVHGRVPGFGDRRWGLADLQELAAALDGKPLQHYEPGVIPRIGPREVLPGIWAGNLDGARYNENDFAVISLCRLGDPFPHEGHRMAYMADNDYNSELDAVLADILDDLAALRAEGRKVLVHCHGGASRTGPVLRAWLVRTEGMSPDEATAHVAERWPHLGPWNASFTPALERVRSEMPWRNRRRVTGASRSTSLVYVPTVADLDHEHQQLLVVDLVDDPEISGTDAPLPCTADQPSGGRRPRVCGQQVDRRLHSSTARRIQLAQLTHRGRGQPDVVGHDSPRSALTCSQGTGSSADRRISARAASASRMSAMSSASAWSRSRSSAETTAATRRPRLLSQTGSWVDRAASTTAARSFRASEMLRSTASVMYKMYKLGPCGARDYEPAHLGIERPPASSVAQRTRGRDPPCSPSNLLTMSKRAHRHKAARPKPGRSTSRRSGRLASTHREPDLMDGIVAALAADEPLPLLGVASSLLAAFDDGPSFPGENQPPLPSRDDVVQSFFDVDLVETSALLAAVAGLTGDVILRRRVRQEIADRRHVLPHWLLAMDEAEPVDGVFEMRHVLGDGENIVLGVRLPGGHELCAAVYIDHNLGTVVKDAYVVPGGLAELGELMRTTADDPDTTLTGLDPADARVRITEAIELGANTFPPLETDTWPACRPLVEWAVGLLPAGGTGYVRPEWTDGDKQALAERFFASPFGAGQDDADRRGLLDSLLWFGTDYGPGDPLRWSPVAVEILLADWIPRKIVADVPYLAQAPDLLRAFVRFSHAERGIRDELTAETLTAVDELEPTYQATIRTPRPQGPMALLAAMGALDPEGPWPDVDDGGALTFGEIMLARLYPAVGGAQALDELDDALLPDEPFDWTRVPPEARERVAGVLALVDRGCDALLGLELRTAARRVLARAAAGDPQTLRRGGVETTAAAICWIVAKANEVFDESDLTVKQLLDWFGVSANTPSQRGKALLRAIGVDAAPYGYGGLHLGSSDYLTAARRAGIIAARDRFRG